MRDGVENLARGNDATERGILRSAPDTPARRTMTLFFSLHNQVKWEPAYQNRQAERSLSGRIEATARGGQGSLSASNHACPVSVP
jgi:hypothetical protein